MTDIKGVPVTEIKLTSLNSMQVFALSAYDEPLKMLIRAKNYGNILASRQLGYLMSVLLPPLEGDYLVPIPLHWMRYNSRGFNQAEEIATILSQAWNIPLALVLLRRKRTMLQSQLPSSLRFDNIKEAFTLNHTVDLAHKRLILVDDLMTTGATFTHAGRLLLSANPASVKGVVACRAR